ncbi:NUDIX domain-containing protein [Streptococcus agalactiae]|nr:NUDIX domain-containing protein [Streptococcus agalactiae]
MGINLFLVKSRNSTIQDLFLFVFTQDILHYRESFYDALVREVHEETGLTISNPKLVGMKHWYTDEGIRYLVFLYKTYDFSGELQSSDEGDVVWIERSQLDKIELAYDMLNLLRVFDEDDISEMFYSKRLEDGFIRKFY